MQSYDFNNCSQLQNFQEDRMKRVMIKARSKNPHQMMTVRRISLSLSSRHGRLPVVFLNCNPPELLVPLLTQLVFPVLLL